MQLSALDSRRVRADRLGLTDLYLPQRVGFDLWPIPSNSCGRNKGVEQCAHLESRSLS